jgi:hypothetical protein
VPGQGKRAAEGIYITLNMDIEISVPIVTYARVEAYPSDAEADRALQTRYEKYPLKRDNRVIKGGPTIAQTGYSEDEGKWFAGWTVGSYMVWTQTSFQRKIPYTKKKFLENVGTPVIQGIDTFQRTGKEGLEL